MEDPIQYSFSDYTIDEILIQIREADEECKRITNMRYKEMSSYEDDEMYDEIQNWTSQAVKEINKRNEMMEAEMPPLTLDEIQMAETILKEKKSKMGTLPTLDEYWAMSEGERCRWMCLHCCNPAVEGATIPGSYCSVLCAASKYS